MRMRAVRSTLAMAAAAFVGVSAPPAAVADVASARRPLALFTPGVTAAYALDGNWHLGGELVLGQYVGGFGYGAAFGGTTSGRIYAEVQPALVLGGRHNLVLGLNPGVVVDVTASKPRWGGQATLWLNYALARRNRTALGSPVVPFARGQAVDTFGFTFMFGVMLKLPLAAS